MRSKRNRKQNAGDSETLMRVVSGIGLMGMLAVFIAIGIMACLAFGSDASADEQSVSVSSAPSGKNARTGKASFDAHDIKVQVEVGMGNGNAVANSYTPVHVTLQNGGEDFEGYFRMFPNSSSNAVMYEKKVSIAAGEKKNIAMFISVSANTYNLTAALCDEDGGVIKSKLVSVQTYNRLADGAKTIAVLSDDTSGLGYFSGSDFALSELTRETLMDDVRGLDMIDVLLINNFDTQSLSEKQVEAVTKWVENGGVLLLGTGAQAEKTLNAFSGKLLNGTIGDTRTIQTRFGSDSGKVDALRVQLQNDLHSEKLDAVKKFLADNLSTDMYNMYSEEIQKLDYAGSYKNTLLAPSDDIYRELNKTFKAEELDKQFDVSVSEEELEERTSAMPKGDITKDITTLRIDNSKSLLTQDKEQLISLLEYGSGHIIVAEFDLSLENRYWTGYGAVLKGLIAQNCDTKRMDYVANNEYEDSTYLWDGLKINEVSGLPNMGLYMIVLILYVVLVGPVAYVILRRRDKRHLLWVIVPSAAVLCSVMIYLIGTTTRIQKPYINYLSHLVLEQDGMAQLDTVFSLTSPNNKAYQVKVEGNQDIRPFYNAYWYADTSNNMNTSYQYGLEYADDATTLHMDNVAAFDSSKMRNSQKVEQKERLEFSSLKLASGSYSGIVTNHLPYDLEDCSIVYAGEIIRLGDIGKGESVSLDKIKQSQNNYTNYVGDWEEVVSVAFTGDPYSETRDTHKARRIKMLAHFGRLDSDIVDVPDIYFYGFRADGGETPFTKLFNLDRYGETAIVQEITQEDMTADGEVTLGKLSDFEVSSAGWKSGQPTLTVDADGRCSEDITVVYNLKDAIAKLKKKSSVKAIYTAVDNSEFMVYGADSYVDDSIFMGTISVVDPKTGDSKQWATAGEEAELENLEKYMDDSGNVTLQYHVQSDLNLDDDMYSGVQLPVIRLSGKQKGGK